MKTENFIDALAADLPSTGMPIARTLALCTLAGALLAGLVFLWTLGVRPDFAEASLTARFQFKLVYTLALLIPALALTWHLARPGVSSRAWLWALLIPFGALIVACVLELAAVPSGEWASRLVGSHAWAFLTIIPVLSLAPLAALLFGLSRGAPTRRTLAGAAAGLASAALAAALYASNCPDDSPLFVAAWYTIAIGSVTFVGALLGSYVLRW
ncbi:MAG: DUF1109 family protein [Alphaproteobacteria bacterium]|nr:DUF1109 family protein [Alphaproteobacteria bacterium]